jgi:hypothetical protein
MDQEFKLFSALSDARSRRLDPTGRKLALIDGEGETILVFTRM